MMFEKITYGDDFPINITIANIEEYPIHYHQDIEFVFVLKGQITLKNGYCNYTLCEGDIFTNSGHEVHSLSSNDPDNMVAIIQISTHYFSQYFPSLSRACYRTYTNKPRTKKQDLLQEKLLTILLQYSIKSNRYKSECIYTMIDVIKYLEKTFNLFIFNGDMVVNFESGNQETIERISHIIGYIYQNYAEKITLEDLAEMEHLSTFYLSHIIKNHTGMNFREFLCFARVEWSEIQLLDTNKKISQVARDVGFSTTAYYEKYFRKWFGHSPQEHREIFLPKIRSDFNQEVLTPTPPNKAITLIKAALSSLNSQKNSSSLVNQLKLEINVDTEGSSLKKVGSRLNVSVTCEDFDVLGFSIFKYLLQLCPEVVTLLISEEDDPQKATRFHSLLTEAGFHVEQKQKNLHLSPVITAANDTIAMPIYLAHEKVRTKEEWLTLSIRDQSFAGNILTGSPAVLTSDGIKKPSFFAYQVLSYMKGDLLCWGKQYAIIRSTSKDEEEPCFYILVSNFDDDIYNMCVEETTSHQAKSILNEFKDEIDFSASLNLAPGMYSVMKYALTKNHNIFSYLASFDFNDDTDFMRGVTPLIPTEPELEIYQEDVRANFNINFTIKGVGLQLAIVKRKGDSKDAK
ncbi:MAG: helix-turn-helix transcriptional regulator [Firmicutes bacterium]|nr:helix-turn-helix transcriptional regulator [Bacillota bacterium]